MLQKEKEPLSEIPLQHETHIKNGSNLSFNLKTLLFVLPAWVRVFGVFFLEKDTWPKVLLLWVRAKYR